MSGASSNNPKFLAELFTDLLPEVIDKLSVVLDALSMKYIAEMDTLGDKYAYHQGGHAAEMDEDAKNAAKLAADKLFPGSPGAAKLYIKLLQCMHAVHDVVQGQPIAGQNEIKSADRFNIDFAAEFKNIAQEANVANSEEILQAITAMAKIVIIDGTTFDFGQKKTTFIKKLLKAKNKEDLLKDPDTAVTVKDLDMAVAVKDPAIVAAAIYISINDTMRMVEAPAMLENEIFKKQYNKLDGNMLVSTLEKNLTREGLFGGDLYLHTKNWLKPIDSKPATVQESKSGLFQLWGQNLRVICEMNFNASSIARDLAKYIKTGETVEFDNETTKFAYDFIVEKMTQELGDKSFCAGMAWTKDGIPAINKKFKELCGKDFNIIDKPYNAVWKDYRKNANGVLYRIQKDIANTKNDAEKIILQRKFVFACLDVARYQTGYFIKESMKEKENVRLSEMQKKSDDRPWLRSQL